MGQLSLFDEATKPSVVEPREHLDRLQLQFSVQQQEKSLPFGGTEYLFFGTCNAYPNGSPIECGSLGAGFIGNGEFLDIGSYRHPTYLALTEQPYRHQEVAIYMYAELVSHFQQWQLQNSCISERLQWVVFELASAGDFLEMLNRRFGLNIIESTIASPDSWVESRSHCDADTIQYRIRYDEAVQAAQVYLRRRVS